LIGENFLTSSHIAKGSHESHFQSGCLNTEALYEKLFTASPDAIIVVDGSGTIVDANPKVESLFGYARAELLGRSIGILMPEWLRSLRLKFRRALSSRRRMFPTGFGLELCGRRKDGNEVPVDVVLSTLESGGAQFVLSFIRDFSNQKRMEGELRKMVLTDPLTGLGNYRRLQEVFEAGTKWFQRFGRSTAVLLLDLDGLKRINDTHGHLVGSRALCRLANAIREECRAVDVAVRHGGDEFAIILPETGGRVARSLAERIASRLAQDGQDPTLSFSYGMAVYPDDAEILPGLLELADGALYEMKKSKHESPAPRIPFPARSVVHWERSRYPAKEAPGPRPAPAPLEMRKSS
jgi:diguanylate cyclase (GGDEF)-like protein/PAS domain S-box-containing protein